MIHDLGKRLKIARIGKGLSQKQVAELLDVSKSTISQYETGESSPPTSALMKLTSIFGVSADFLLGLEAHETLIVDGLAESQKEALKLIVEELRKANNKKDD